MTALAGIRALTFDVFGTVVDWRSGVMREAEALGRRKDLDRDWAAFADRWRELYQPSLSRVRNGEIPWTKLDDLHRVSLEQVLDDFRITGLSEAELDHLNRSWHRLDPWPDVVDALQRLKPRFILATLSNGNVSLMVNLAKSAGLPWDAILGAEVAQAYKPQREAYLATARFLDLEPAQCLMVAAHHYDLVAARSCGFRTAYVDRSNEFGPHPQEGLPEEHGHDVVAGDFRELADQLEAVRL